MSKIRIENKNEIIESIKGKSLLEALVKNKIFIENPCNGKGTCGKCKVKILTGNELPISPEENKFLNPSEIENGIRLACFVFPQNDMSIEIPELEKNHRIMTDGYIPEFSYNPSLRKEVFKIEKPSLENQIPFEERLKKSLAIDKLDWRILKNSTGIEEEITAIFYDDTLIGIEEGNTREKLFGISVDIGTTTIAASLTDIKNGKILSSSSMINSQKKFGLDVLTRITYAMNNSDTAISDLQKSIVSDINHMIQEMCSDYGILSKEIYEIDVAGNSTMLHFLLGVNSLNIGKSPFVPNFTSSKSITASDIGIDIFPGGILYCLPSVSAYIGADIISGIYVCSLHKATDRRLFIDIGTNGEIVLSDRGKLISCSCAAGPALEGMNISCGMRAAGGAIEDISISQDKINLDVIGGENPKGLCGSGIISAVKELLRIGLVKKDGSFIKKDMIQSDDYRYNLIQLDGKKREFVLQSTSAPIIITQKDIRQVQLAKGAILSGFYALLENMDLSIDQLDRIIIAGQFGSHLPAESLIGCGILPEIAKDKLEYVGNSSKTGAYMTLMSRNAKEEIESLSSNVSYMELGASKGYERLFADCLIFPEIIK